MYKQILFAAFFIGFSFCLFAQEKVAPEKDNEVYNIVEDMPDFPGGQEALFEF